MRIQHNILAMNAYRNYNTNTSALAKNLEKLSSGYKINRAGDDAAGLAISEKMRAQITGLNAAQKNVKDGISLVKTAEGAMQEIQDMLNRMSYLATQSANGTYDNEVDRAALQKEVEALKSEINRIAESANFNGINLLDGKTAAAHSTNAVGALDKNSLIDGVKASAAEKASATVAFGKSASAAGGSTGAGTAIEFDADNSVDGVDPTKATQEVWTITVTDKNNFATDSSGSPSAISNVEDLKEAFIGSDGLNLGSTAADFDKYYDIQINGSSTTDTASFNDDDVITITRKTAGATGFDGTALDGLDIGGADVNFEVGKDIGGGTDATNTEYTITIDVTKLSGGDQLVINGKYIEFTYDSTKSNGASAGNSASNPYYINISDLGTTGTNNTFADKITDELNTALASFTDVIGNTTGLFKAELSDDTSDTTGAGTTVTIKLTAVDGGSDQKLTISTIGNSESDTVSDGIKVVEQIGEDEVTGEDATLTSVVFTDDLLKTGAGGLEKGASFTINGKTYEIVDDAETDVDETKQVKESDVEAKILQLLNSEYNSAGKYNVEYDSGTGTISFTEKNPTNTKAADLAKTLGVEISVAAKEDTSAAAADGQKFTIGTTDLYVGNYTDEEGNSQTPSTAKDLVDALAALDLDGYDAVLKDAKGNKIDLTQDASTLQNINLEAGMTLEFTAKRAGALGSDDLAVLNDSFKDADGKSIATVTNGWDEGETGAGAKTRYDLTISTDKLAGGQSFSFGTGEKVFSFQFDLNSKDTDNGGIGDGKILVGDEERLLITYSLTDSDEDIAAKIQEIVGKAMKDDFDVTATVNGGSIEVSVVAKESGEKYNLGQVRYDTEAGSMKGTYQPYSDTVKGTPGTYAQASWDFDASELQAGDKLTIGGYTVTITDEMVEDTNKIVEAFETIPVDKDGKNLFTGKISIDNGKLTITGSVAGQTGQQLADAMDVKLKRDGDPEMISGGLTLQIGDTSASYNKLTVQIGDMHTTALGIDDLDIGNVEGANAAIDVIKNAINYVSSIRGDLGATQNRLEHTANNLSVMAENIQDAESTIRDTDVAEEMMAYTKNNILIQSAQAMLAQANAVPQGVLQLLG